MTQELKTMADIKKLRVKAERIAIKRISKTDEPAKYLVVCFNYDKTQYEKIEQSVGQVVDLEIEDSNGLFLSDKPRIIEEVSAPLKGVTMIADDILFITVSVY